MDDNIEGLCPHYKYYIDFVTDKTAEGRIIEDFVRFLMFTDNNVLINIYNIFINKKGRAGEKGHFWFKNFRKWFSYSSLFKASVSEVGIAMFFYLR